ncbi:MAG: cell division ATP-binding protein FtsE [Bifidobacterium pullorum]|uniref:cell division ATP-binding protein FtsE n=1 Tax=Bifidobacterium pullorum TaxID=78448 RepID=UPI0039956F1D
MALISLDHVSKVYPRGTRPALDDVTLHVERGDFVFLVGASGSGKTTLLSLLLREEEATDGEIRVAGNDLRRLTNRQVPQYRRSIGFVFQDYKLLNNKTVWQNVAFALEVIGTSRSTIRALVPKVLETVGLTGKERNYPHELSGGEQQRVAIARAYVNHPQILLADEPTGNLDPTTSLGIMEVLDAINRTGTTIVMATHNEEIVNSMRKRVVELHNGKIVRDEAQGSYDSALYFPDAEVESKAQLSIESNDADARFRPDGDSASTDATIAIEVTGDRRETAAQVIDAVSQAVSAGAGDEGIARLAQSVHSGRTGRYGEAFAPVEDTLTWGRGLSLEEYAEAERREFGEERQTEPDDAAETDDAQPAEQTETQAGEQQTPRHADESTAAPVPPAPAAEPPMPPTQPDRSSEEDSTGEENR